MKVMRKFLRKLVRKRLEAYTKQLITTHQPMVIAVTGSVGKTSTKLAIAHMLRTKYKVLVHEGNYNTEFGLPLTIFEMDPPEKVTDVRAWLRIFKAMRARISQAYPYDVMVLEMGADQPGDIGHFMTYIRPDIGVITAVAKVHIEAFDSIDSITEEKWKLARNSKKVIYNYDDERLRERGANTRGSIGYGLQKTDVWAELNEFYETVGWYGTLHAQGASKEAAFPVIGKQSVYSLIAAAAVSIQSNITLDVIDSKIAGWVQPNGRMHLLRGKNDTRIIDDSYNSSPYAAVAALDALYQYKGRKIAILGSMNELGDYEAQGHRMVGNHCAQLDMLVTIGLAANKYLLTAAMEAGLDSSRVHECNTPYEAGDYVAALLQPNDTVLVKGSQNGVFAEEAIKPLLAYKEGESLLVRQSDQWLKKKKEQFGQ